ncbi:MAG TPA: FAD-dependent oxidoreductase [Pyrinomonadaceae bacterium]|jgi:monomeric sarcosine oxidase|nr:FAD-dependent oxidoreductase [Pyrinomonadaceae bacterium]
MSTDQTFDVAVIGAGAFGAWTAYQLKLAGAQVLLLDGYGAANSRASSGGESRIIRMGYGPDVIYTRMTQCSFTIWQELFARLNKPQLFQPTGVLWLAKDNDAYCDATVKTFAQCKVKFETLGRAELDRRYPQLELGTISWGILEPDSGILMARQAVQALVTEAQTAGVTYLEATIQPPRQNNLRLENIATTSGQKFVANKFIFACGPWLPKLFPELLGELIYVTRQEVLFLGVPPGDDRFSSTQMPTWMDINELTYCLPALENRGVKIAIDDHGPHFDPDTGDRMVSSESVNAVRAYLAKRIPLLANAPVVESRVCQYENTSNGDFLIDRHPQFENVWLVGGGSGHGFKHGPAVGEHVAALISGNAEVEARFALATKGKAQQRKVF